MSERPFTLQRWVRVGEKIFVEQDGKRMEIEILTAKAKSQELDNAVKGVAVYLLTK